MRRCSWVAAVAVLVMQLTSGQTLAGAPPDQIEEDWQIVIATPDPAGGGPQLSTSMSPVADGSTPFFIFNLNYIDSPTYSPGGMQVQVWSGTQLVAATSKGSAQCSTTGETITWTQRMTISSGVVSFAIDSGRSATWGKFGQGQQLNVNGTFTTTLNSLSQYTPATSVANSGVGWEPNRVTSMTLLCVRYYANGKLVSTDNTPRPINLTY